MSTRSIINNSRIWTLLLAIMMVFSLWGPAIPKADAASGFTLTYDSNGAASGDVPAQVTALEGDPVTVSNQSANPLTKNGYVFIGWNEVSDGTGALYRPGDSITLTENTILYANWALKIEGEAGTLLGYAEVESSSNASGGKHVGYMDEAGNGVKIDDLSTASYFILRYASEFDGKISLYVNDVYRQDIVFSQTGSWTSYDDMFVYVSINQGDSLSIIYRDGDEPLNMDYFGLIIAQKVEVAAVSLDKSALALTVGQRETLIATVLPGNATNRRIDWTSSNPSVASVDANGRIKAVSKGTATISAASQDDPTMMATSEVVVDNPPGGIPYAVEVSGGDDHFLVLMSNGTVMAMGENGDYQLGDGTYIDAYEEPVEVLIEENEPLTGIKAISTNGYHSLALDLDGQVWAWGSNWNGESGAEDEEYVPYATKIDAFADQEIKIVSIEAGRYHSLALDTEGSVWAWGYNEDGELGIGNDEDQYIPQLVQTLDGALAGITAISAGSYHSLALDSYGGIWAWGDGYALNPSDENNGDWYFAELLSADDDVFTSVSAGDYVSLAIDSQDRVRAWGALWDPYEEEEFFFYNDLLQLGDGTRAAKAVFSQKFEDSSSYIKLADDSYWCWGICLEENGMNDFKMEVDAPKKRPELQGFASISSMDDRMVGLKRDATVWMWNVYQEKDTRFNTPSQSSVTDVVYGSAGNQFGLALKSDGRVYGWGYNSSGQVGNMTADYTVIYNAGTGSVVDANRDPIEGIVAIDSGRSHSLALTIDGEVWAWGENWNSQIGDATEYNLNYARKIPGLTDAAAVSAGENHNLALKSDGTVVAWGSNWSGQIHGSAGGNVSVPVPVNHNDSNAMTGVKAIAAGYNHSAVVVGDEGAVWFWGNNINTKKQVMMDGTAPLLGITAIAAGNYQTIALKNDGTVWSWWTSDTVAAQVQTNDGPLTGIIQIALEAYHALALDSNGEVWAWGDNDDGQLGIGSFNDLNQAQQIAGLSGVKQVAVGYDHSYAVGQNGVLWSFGGGYYNQLAIPQVYELIMTKVSAFQVNEAYSPGNGDGGDGGGIGGGGWTGTQEPALLTSTDGKITIPVGRAGETSLDNEIILTVPVGAAEEEITITIEKLADTANLANYGEIFASAVFEVLKNFKDNFKKPILLTLKFDTSKIKEGQHASIFYYDETEKVWVEIGGQVDQDLISAEVDHFTKFTVLAVDDVKVPSLSDIAGHWAEANIKQAVQQGIVNGYPDGTFKPNANVTRAEFTVMLMNALRPDGEGASISFTDEQKIGAWARAAIAHSVKAGIVTGYQDGSFRPGSEITRTELAVMVARAHGVPAEAAATTGFVDDVDIPAWAKPAIAWVKQLGIVNGQGDNKFAPNAAATRAEAITIILNLLQAKS